MLKTTKIIVYLLLSGFTVGCMADVVEDAKIENIENALRVATDFKVGIQLIDHGQRPGTEGDWAWTGTYEGANSNTESPWACDSNCYNPDSARVEIDGFTSDDVKGKDFRFCMRGSDGEYNHTQVGYWTCTPWASNGGGTSGMATDSNAYDPDSYKIQIRTRDWPSASGDEAIDVRLRIRGHDYREDVDDPGPGSWSSYTGWASQGGGRSGWGTDRNAYEPDGFELDMDVRETNIWDFCTSTHQCQHGFGDCDPGKNQCKSGTTCVENVGHAYGYADNGIDVCVD